MISLASQGNLAGFVGMLTDSRSFLSYTRHEYFRRILCQLLGEWVEAGEFPCDINLLGEIVRDISYNNSLCPISAGRQFLVEGVAVTLRENIPQGHKFAVKDIWTGDQIIKYGAPIGTAVCDIPAGAWVHVHNVKTNLEEHVTYTYQKAV